MTRPAREAKDRPAYAIASVDHALRLASILQLEGKITVSGAAERLGVAPSTAHRLLSMLVYRDFAVREGRSYRVGPVLVSTDTLPHDAAQLRQYALPHLQHLVEQLDETCNLTILTGTNARFVASVECTQALRVGNRAGMVFPAHRNSGGLVLLAELDDEEVRRRYTDAPPSDVPNLTELFEQLGTVRDQGFAINNGLSERGVLAIGYRVRDTHGNAVAAATLAMPTVRFEPGALRSLLLALKRTARAIEDDLP